MGYPGGPRPPSAMLTDLCQLTMAYTYWKSGITGTDGCFHLYFRGNPFDGGCTVACGLAQAIEYLENLHFTDEDTAYLATLTGRGDTPLFSPEFLSWLRGFQFTCAALAIPEGTIVFPNEPLLRVTGPIAECQLVETALLSIVNFQTLPVARNRRSAEFCPICCPKWGGVITDGEGGWRASRSSECDGGALGRHDLGDVQ